MSCYHPYIMIETSDMTDPKQRAIVERLKVAHKHDDKVKSVNTLFIPREVAEREGLTLKDNKAVLIPCGQCIGCRLDYSRQWAERCIHEAELHDYNYFLTLTYDDEHLPIGDKGNATLVKDELQKFMKRLRRKYSTEFGITGIRFFACGEYGDPKSGERVFNPHYHIILFNMPIPDLQERHPINKDGKIVWIKQFDIDGNQLLYSPSIASCWTDEKHHLKGTCEIGQVSYESCAYVARYVVKKQKGKSSSIYGQLGIVPEFVRMSLKPGIGYEWYQEHLEHIYLYDNVSFKRGDVVVNQKPGKYCDKLLKNYDQQRYYDLKAKRHQSSYDAIDLQDSLGHELVEQNLRKEQIKTSQTKMLKRTI